MNICGILVYAFPDRLTEVGSALARIPGVEVHGCAGGGRLIITVEDTETSAVADRLSVIHALPGVAAAFLTYHQFEPDPVNAGADKETSQP